MVVFVVPSLCNAHTSSVTSASSRFSISWSISAAVLPYFAMTLSFVSLTVAVRYSAVSRDSAHCILRRAVRAGGHPGTRHCGGHTGETHGVEVGGCMREDVIYMRCMLADRHMRERCEIHSDIGKIKDRGNGR